MRKLTAIFLITATVVVGQENEPPIGLRVTYKAGEAIDAATTANIRLYVPAG